MARCSLFCSSFTEAATTSLSGEIYDVSNRASEIWSVGEASVLVALDEDFSTRSWSVHGRY